MGDSPGDFQAVVFAAGQGTRMPSLTDHLPKLMLPLANLPLYWFPLNLLARNGVKDCLLVVPFGHRTSIEKALKNGQLPELPGLNIEVVAFEASGEEEVEQWGTADVARRLLHRLKSDHILLVSGDLVTDLKLATMLRLHAARRATVTCLLTDAAQGGPVPGSKERAKKYRDFVLLGPDDGHSDHRQLLYLADEDDFTEEDGVPRALFARSPDVLATARYKDVHLYAIERKALELLKNSNSPVDFASIKADLIPVILRKHDECWAWIPSKSEFSLISQCNNVGAYFEANKAVLKQLPKMCPGIVQKELDRKCATECWVGEGVELGEKCQLKRTIIGSGCKLGQGAKLDGSVVMAGAQIGEGVVLKNSIVFSGARIGQKADLTMCIIGPEQEVVEKSKLSNATIAEERTMQLED